MSTAARPERRVHPIVSLDYRIRIFGTVLASVGLTSVFSQRGAGLLTWVALAVWALVWPHVAFLSARHGRDTKNAEITNLIIDGAIGGTWIALVHFNPWLTVMFVLALTLAYLSVGGIKLWLAAMGAFAVTALAGGAANGFAFDPITNLVVATVTTVCL